MTTWGWEVQMMFAIFCGSILMALVCVAVRVAMDDLWGEPWRQRRAGEVVLSSQETATAFPARQHDQEHDR